jgi:hypothetical protein
VAAPLLYRHRVTASLLRGDVCRGERRADGTAPRGSHTTPPDAPAPPSTLRAARERYWGPADRARVQPGAARSPRSAAPPSSRGLRDSAGCRVHARSSSRASSQPQHHVRSVRARAGRPSPTPNGFRYTRRWHLRHRYILWPPFRLSSVMNSYSMPPHLSQGRARCGFALRSRSNHLRGLGLLLPLAPSVHSCIGL